ncbi:fumarate hydratase [Thermospira aquatica]|uniref:Fumarate hydratase n=1 Tax=Thermospira aquatica TaxID=2828656 RepID=A0AAX3BF12_9SPIR|nr:fumarate hydratase [Thermospira aquatica]URA10947.1 fumarate hydratase [Thermospira aquatica]
MKKIKKKDFVRRMEEALHTAHFSLRPDVLKYFQEWKKRLPSSAEEIFGLYEENARFAKTEERVLCQDTGYIQVYLYIGRVCFDFPLQKTIEDVVRDFYRKNHLRMSLAHPLTRENTGDNTPVFINTEWTEKEGFECVILVKGGGSENVTRNRFFLPTENVQAIEDWVVEEMKTIGSKGCPPYLLGLCIGGTMEKAIAYSKQLLLKPLGASGDPMAQEIAHRLKERINALGIGLQGLGLGETVMDVFVKLVPCHIATLPVAFSLGCHAVRQAHFSL